MGPRPWISLLLLAGPTCARPEPPTPALDVVLVGCAALDGHTCVRPGASPSARCDPSRVVDDAFTPVVWFAGGRAGDALVVEGDTPARSDGVEIDGGRRFELVVPDDARALTLVRDGIVRERWTIATPIPDASGLDHDADAAFREAGAAEATDRPARWRDALAVTEAAYAAARDGGDVLRARCHVRRGLFVALERLGDPAALERWSARLDEIDAPQPAFAGADAYARGLLAQRIGDLQTAASAFRAAERGASRIADRKLAAAATGQLADVLASLGRDDEIAAVLERAETAAAELDCRGWLHALNNTSWSRVVIGEAGRTTDDPLPDLAFAALVLGAATDPDDACHDPRLAEHVQLGLALVAAAEGWFGWAEQLRDALPPPSSPTTDPWRDELDRRLAFAQEDRGALVEWAVVHDRDPPPPTADAAWSHAWARGRIHEALGATDDALAAYGAAELALSSMMLQLEFDAGRDRLLLGRQRTAGRSVALRVAAGDAAGALCVARNARARTSRVLDRSARIAALSPDRRRQWAAALAVHAQHVRDLDALRSERWSVPLDRRDAHDRAIAEQTALVQDASRTAAALLAGTDDRADPSCDRLGAPTDGELALLYFPIDDDAWMGFAFGAHGVVAKPLGGLAAATGDALARRLLEPFAAQIDAAESLLVLPTGMLWAVDFAELPWRGRTLLDALPIALGLDLDRTREPANAAGRRALVIADPRGNLPAALHEAESVRAALGGDGWSVTSLVGRDAHAEAVRDALVHADLVHYAGHGEHGGLEGWQGALQLADGARLGITDVLALASVPELVVLPACDTAPSERTTQGGDMNIARAFLLAGSRAVVAAQGPIDDDLAARIAIALHGSGSLDASLAPARLRDALLAVRRAATPSSQRPLADTTPAARVVVLVR